MKFGEKLRQLRLEKGFTQEEVASAVKDVYKRQDRYRP